MALPNDYDSPLGEEEAELEIRKAIVECFLSVAGNPRFGFDSDHAHTRLRYPDKNSTWEFVASIVDPDTASADPTEQTRLVRYFAVALVGVARTLKELTLRYAIKISFGFKDVYASNVNLNSSDELTACLMQYQKFLANNLNLGLDDRVSHQYLTTTNVRFVLKDAQGSAVQVSDNTLNVILEVC
jgi:hypothetical protein